MELWARIGGLRWYCWYVRGLRASERVLVLLVVAEGPAVASQLRIVAFALVIVRTLASSSPAVCK